MCEGKLFHIHAPATEKVRRPTGMIMWSVRTYVCPSVRPSIFAALGVGV